MFFLVSKLLGFLVSPTIIAFIFFLLGFVQLKRKKKFHVLFIIGFSILILFTNEFIFKNFASIWEISPVNKKKTGAYSLGIVLGGFSNYNEKNEKIDFTANADRILQTIDLYKTGKISKIIISGGSGRVVGFKFKESEYVSQYLKNLGIPDIDIIIENRSRNTHENALFTKTVLKDSVINRKILLITSASHMRRAKACFIKVGFSVDTYSTNSLILQNTNWFDYHFIPKPYLLSDWENLCREIIGYLSYWFMGYI
jgi:uncharacterized SAM-binding protein YcdF (DUF218 family)